MSFLTIPGQEGLFTPVNAGQSAGDRYRSTTPCPVDEDHEEDDEDDDEDDGSEEVRFIPRCSPIPKRRGQSIYDEAAEYMRIQLSLPAAKRRVSFADTTGGDLVDVREFVAFGSDEEEDPSDAAEDAQSKEATYRIQTEFQVATKSALAEAVQTNKVEVEMLSPIEDEPLAFSGVVRVLNISYHKAVYIRSTMDDWATYYDHPAEYVQGSNDGETDAFGFKLSFSPPYDTHGSRIEFVVRYETSDGDFWANNSHKNYVATLLISYEDNLPQVTSDTRQEIRGILKVPKFHSVHNDEQHMDEEDFGTFSQPVPVRPTPICPIIIHPEIDLETADVPFGAPLPTNQQLQSPTAQRDEVSTPQQSPCVSCHSAFDQPLHVSSRVHTALQSSDSRSLPSVPCESVNPISEHLEEAISGSALQPIPTPFQPHAPSTSSLAEDVEQGRDSFALDKLQPFTVTRPPVTDASIHFSSGKDEVEILHMTLGDRKVQRAQFFSRGEKDLLSETRKHLDSELNKHQSKRSPKNSIAPDNMVGKLRLFKMDESLHTAPLANWNNPSIPDGPSSPNTQLPAASVMPSEQPSSETLPFKLLDISMTTNVENTDAGREHVCMLTQLELLRVEGEPEQNKREAHAVLISHSDDHSDKEQNTRADQVNEEQATPGDTAAFLEKDEKVQQAMATLDICKTNEEQSLLYQSSDADKPFIFQLGTLVKHDLLCCSDSEVTTAQTSLVDHDMIFRDALDNLKETSRRPEGASTDLVSSDSRFTPSTPESPPYYMFFPSVGPSELATTPSVDSPGASPPCVPQPEGLMFPGGPQQAVTSNVVANDTSETADASSTFYAMQGKEKVVEPPEITPDVLAELQPYTSQKADGPSRSHTKCNAGRNIRLSMLFLCGVVCISVVLNEPSSLFFVGLVLFALLFLIVIVE